MKRHCFTLSLMLALLFLLPACPKDAPTPTQVDAFYLPDGVAGIRRFRIQFLANAPAHTQTSMLTLYQNKLYRIGSKWPVRVLDLTSLTWSQIPLPDSTYWRWDGAAVSVGDSILIAAVYYNCSYDILALQTSTGTFRHTGANLPQTFDYPAYCLYQDDLILLTARTDSALAYGINTGNLRAIAPNPFFDSTAWYRALFSGRYGTALYVFGRAPGGTSNAFSRFELSTRQWESIPVPEPLRSREVTGSVFGDQFVLLCDTTTKYDYSISENLWYLDTSQVPVFSHPLPGYMQIGEWSYCSTDSCLYGTDVFTDKVWKISRY